MVMTVTCSACAASFPVDPNKIPEGGVKVRCSVCANIFRVERPAPEVSAPEPETPQEQPVEAAPEPAVPDQLPGGAAPEAGAQDALAEDAVPADASHDSGVSEDEALPTESVAEESPEEVQGAWGAGVEAAADAELANGEDMPDWAAVEEPTDHAEAAGAWDELETESEPEAELGTEPEPEVEPQVEVEPQIEEESAAPAEEESAGWAEPASGAAEPEIKPEPIYWAEPDEVETHQEAGPDLPETPFTPEPDTAAEAELSVEQPEPPVQGFTFGKRDPMDKARRLARVLVSDMVMYNSERHQLALSRGSLAEDFAEEIDKSWKEFVEQVGPDIAEGEGRRFWKQALNDILAKGEPAF